MEQRELFFQLCVVLGIKPTMPERYVPHRWLSVLDVTLDTMRLFDALTLYTASFIPLKDRETYQEIVDEVLKKRAVNNTGKQSVDKIQLTIRKKWSAYTKEGKDRNLRLVDKVFITREKSLATFQVYKEVLPTLKECVVFSKERASCSPPT